MDAGLSQLGGTALLLIHSSANSGNVQLLTSAPQQLLSKRSDVVRGSSLRATPATLPQSGPGEAFQIRKKYVAQELFWRNSLSESTLLWDSTQQEKDAHSPHSRHRESQEILWLINFWKPAGVGELVAALDTQLWPQPSTIDNNLPNDSGPCSIASNRRYATAETVSKLCEKGELSEAVDVLGVLVQVESRVCTSLFCTVLKICNSHKNLNLGRRVHELSTKAGYQSSTFLANHILRMYASHGRLQEVKDVFSKLTKPDAFSWSAVIAAHAKHGEPRQAIRLYQKMQSSGLRPDNHVFVAALQACARAPDLESGRQVHADFLKGSIQPNLFVWNSLVDMYAKCGRLEDARTIFDGLVTRDVVTWNTMIAGYAEVGHGHAALALYEKMELGGLVLADSYTFACLLKACASVREFQQGKQLHSQIMHRGLESDTVISNSLVDMYVSCGKLEDARRVFDSLSLKDVVSWTTMIAGYAEHGLGQEALTVYDRMEREGLVQANSFTFACLLKACGTVGDLQRGKHFHAKILEGGLDADVFVGNSLVSMYVKCGRLEEACRVFDSLPSKDLVTWTAMIAGYAENGRGQEALALYTRMERAGVTLADSVSFSCLLKACASVAAVQLGMQLHTQILKKGLESDLFVGTCLVDMYAKCSRLEEARMVFDSLVRKDVVTWNAMISGYAEHGFGQDSIDLYEKMKQERLILADTVTFISLLKACSAVGDLEQGKQLHSEILERGLAADRVLGTCLVDMYLTCGRLEDALMVFDSLATKDVVTWTTMIARCTENGLGQEALGLYDRMKQECPIPANSYTFSCLLTACGSIGALQEGKELHSQILERGLQADAVMGTGLVDMYVKCGQLEDARRTFDSLRSRDVVTWNTMIAGYAKHGLGQEALALHHMMEQEGLSEASSFTFACLLKACATVAALQQGKQLHAQILERGLKFDAVLGNCLVDMFAKCGKLEDARRVFDSLPSKDVVTWTTMINGYGQAGEAHNAIECFQEMRMHGVEADETTFTCLLVACSHEGLVKEGQQFFKDMVEEHRIMPTVEHYTCMVDLLGRAGYLDEAKEMLMSFERNDVGLTSLLNACKCHGDIERGRWCFDSLVKSNPQNAVGYVLMGNIYADAGRWSDVETIERLRKSAEASKKPAVAGIEVDRHVHTFIVGEERGDISSKVQSMRVRLKDEGGHVPQTALVLKRLSEKEKENDLCGHAEKLALAYGLLNTPDGTPLLVTKNLRMCNDCHSSTEIMSKVEKREIIVRDGHRVHRFMDGSCLCRGRP